MFVFQELSLHLARKWMLNFINEDIAHFSTYEINWEKDLDQGGDRNL
jgi:hypothetical protein